MAEPTKDVAKSPEFLRARRAALVNAAQAKHETPEARTQAQAEAIEQLRSDFANGGTGQVAEAAPVEPVERVKAAITYPEGMAPASVLKTREKVRAPEAASEAPAAPVSEVVEDAVPVEVNSEDYPTPAMIGAPVTTAKAKAGKKINDTEAV